MAKDGIRYWYEVIMIDRAHPAVKKDRLLRWVKNSSNTGRVFRGKTAAGRRSRGILTNKGKGAEKLRPSKAAVFRRSR